MKKAIGIFLIFLGCVAPFIWYLIWKSLLNGAEDAIIVVGMCGIINTVVCLLAGGVTLLGD